MVLNITYTGLSVGMHTFYVRATDLAGNDDDTPAVYTWMITPPPTAATVTCGQVITESILLTHDLLDCLEDGLVVGAPGITIDLDGYTIDGTGLGAGIRNDGFASVTIRNGTIQEFDYGVQLESRAAFNIVELLVLNLNQKAGVYLADADDGVSGNIVRHNEIVGNGAGLLITDTVGSLILDNLVAGNMDFGLFMLDSDNNRLEESFIVGSSDVAVILEGSSHNTLVGNSIADNPDGGLEITAASNYNRIENNYVAESGDAGIIVSHSVGNEIVDNTVREMSDSGIVLEAAQQTLVYGNDLRFNNGGVELSGASNNRIEANNASSTDGVGIEVGDFSESNIIVQNTVNNNSAGGISIGGTAPAGYGNLLDRNTANNNGDTGIAVEGVGHIIVGNEANNNDGWGIYSAEGSAAGINIDGGGNRGAGNAELEQCYNVVCNGGSPLPLDQLPPQTLISSGPPNSTVFNSATFDFIGFDNATAVTFQCRLDSTEDADWSACTSPVTYTGLTLGTHTFEVRAIDWSGNIDPTPATHTWTIEPLAGGVPPETTIDSGPDATTASTSATFTFSANEPGVTFECSLDGAPFAACSSPHSVSGLLSGQHEFQVYAIDTENLPDPTPATYVWMVTSAPVPTAVTCGQTLTQSTLLTNDLLNCLGDGLVVGASGITIDLNGRIIDGTGLGVGVRNDGFSSVKVPNGTIQEFDYGVQINGGATNNVAANLTLQQNQDGAIQLLGVQDATVRNNSITGNTQGIELSNGATNVVVRNNTLTDNPGNAIYLLGVSGNRVEANSATGSSGAGVALAGASGNTVIGNTLNGNSDGGVTLLLGANNNRTEANSIRDSGSDGISISESTGNELIGNTVHQSGGSGIALEFADNTVLLGNDVRFNASGIGLTSSSGNLIEANYASTTGGTGIEVDALSFSNTVVLNTVIGNSGEGIAVDGVAPAGQGNLIERNNVSSNGGDGIAVSGGGHTITDNTASVNGGWGIYAAVTGMDGGGNRAFGNDEPAQCFNIVCEIGAWAGQPDTILVLTPDDPTNSSTAIFTFTGIDDTTEPFDLNFECRLDSTDELAWVECENPWIYSGLSEGEHIFEVRASDLQGNIDPTLATFTWLYTALPLGVPPDTFVDRAPPLNTPLFEGFFTFFSNEPDVTFECSLDGAPFAPCGTEEPEVPATTGVFLFEFEEFQVGPHTFQVRAIDIEGLVDPTPATYTWNILGIITTITNGPAYIAPEEIGEPAAGGETIETTATFEFEANIADVVFFCSLDLGPFVPCESGVTYTGLAVGEHLFRVYGEDDEGRTQLEPTAYEWEILPPLDETPPDTVILSGPADPSGSVTFTFTGSDNVTPPAGLVFECSFNDPTDMGFSVCTSPWTYPNPDFPEPLPLGLNTFYVRAIDVEDNIDPTPASLELAFLGDTIAPETTILSGPPATTLLEEVTFTFTANDPFPTFECSLDGVLFEECASPYTVQVDVSGEYELQVRTTDLAGNVGDPTSGTWIFVGPPVTTIESGPDALTAETTATFAFSAVQPGATATFACALDAGPFAPCESPATYTDLTDGTHTFGVQATNSFGLVEAEPAEYVWTVSGAPADATPPDTEITSGPPAVTLNRTATFTFVSNEAGASFQCALNGGSFNTCTTPHTVAELLVAVHTFEVRAVDFAGNIDPTPASYIWEVDGPPVTEIAAGPPEETELTSATFEFVADDPTSTFECWLDGPIGPCTSPISFSGLGGGEHVFAVLATDAAGNVQEQWEDYAWIILPSAPPQTVITSGPGVSTPNTDAIFTFSGSDNVTDPADLTFECRLDSSDETAFVPCTSPVDYSGLADGSHTFEVRAIDEAGNIDPTPASYTWTIQSPPAPTDTPTPEPTEEPSPEPTETPTPEPTTEPTPEPDTMPPDTMIDSGAEASTTSTDASFAFSASEEGSTFECSLDGAAFAGCSSPVVYSGLAVGEHSFSVRATDAAGNTGPTPATYTWTVVSPPDVTAPETVLNSHPPSATAETSAVFTFSGLDNTTPLEALRFECALDGGAFTTCASGVSYSNLSVGAHTFQVRAIDEAGNIDPTPASYTWTVDEPVNCGGPVTVTANADAWIDQNSSSSNKGSDSILTVQAKSSNNNMRALVRFDLPAAPQGCIVESATLRLFASSFKNGRTLQALRVSAGWNENNVTWANQPATSGPAATTASGNGWRQWSVAAQVQEMYTTGNNGFLFRDATENSGSHEQQFHAREKGENIPQLLIQFGPAVTGSLLSADPLAAEPASETQAVVEQPNRLYLPMIQQAQ